LLTSACFKEHCAPVWGVLHRLNPAVLTEAKLSVKNSISVTMESTEYKGRKTPHKSNASA